MCFEIRRKVDKKVTYILFLLLVFPKYSLLAHNIKEDIHTARSRSFPTGLGSFFKSIKSKVWPAIRPAKLERIRNLSKKSERSKVPNIMGKINKYLTDVTVTTRRRNSHLLRQKKIRRMPKIYMTKLPVENYKEVPKIFLTEILKDNDEKQLDEVDSLLTFKEITFYGNKPNNVIIKEDDLNTAKQNHRIYKEGIDDIQIVNQSGNSFSRVDEYKYSTISPPLDYVSSTSMIIRDTVEETNYEKDVSDTSIKNQDVELQKENTRILKDDDWVMPVMILGVVISSFLLCYSVFLCVARRQDKARSGDTLLGQVLLIGLQCCAVISLLHTAHPSYSLCLVIRFVSALSYTIVYATLLVKTVTCISLYRGIHLQLAYQIFLLFFMIIIQIVIGIQWLVASPPDVLRVYSSYSSCTETFTQQLHDHIYNILLIIFLVISSLKFCTVRPVSREILYTSITSVLSIIIWSVWILGGYLLPTQYRGMCSSLTMIASVVVIFTTTQLYTGNSRNVNIVVIVIVFTGHPGKEDSTEDNADVKQDTTEESNNTIFECCP